MTDRELFIPMVVLIFGFVMGWIFAHGTVATECERLGSFYVSSTVYECKVKGREQ